MDVLRKELNSIYAAQHLEAETLDPTALDMWKRHVAISAGVDNDCRVITDASADLCFIYGGNLAYVLGLTDNGSDSYIKEVASSDEDVIYNRIHPEDLVEKRMLEYEFFKFIDTLPPDEKLHYKATCHFRIRHRDGSYIYVDNSTQVIQKSPLGKIWLILCCYNISPLSCDGDGISPRIVNILTGELHTVELNRRRCHILTGREKQILNMIRDGMPSKQIAATLGISIHTVNRHRQNILEKLSVGNSMEAVMAATAMRLL